jgi:DNA invertase Pin-like site-specific DNA recombinase
MKTLAYLRVSTGSQDVAKQKFAILDYAQQQGISIDEFIEAQISSRQTMEKRGIDDVLKHLGTGDRLIVSELSRLGRSLGQIIYIVDTLVKRNIRFVAIKETIRFEGKQTMQTKVMVTLFGLFAEVERDLISERTREGLIAAKAKGKLLGRPRGSLGRSKLDGKELQIQTPLDKKVSKASIAKIMGISRTALYNFIHTRGLDKHLND